MSMDESLAYIAGYMDADGSFLFITSGVNRPIARVQVGSTNKSMLIAILGFFEGFGASGGIYRDKTHTKRAYWILVFGTRSSVLTVCGMLLPHLKIKREAAQALFSFCRFRVIEGQRGNDYASEEAELVVRNRELNSGRSDETIAAI